MSAYSGHTWQEIEEFFIRDKFLNAREAQSYGLIDEVLGDTSSLITLKDSVLEVDFLGEVG